jgi:hypothetical protein
LERSARLLALTAIVALFSWRRSRWTKLGAAVGSVVTLPRLFAYDVTLLLAVQAGSTDEKSPTGA